MGSELTKSVSILDAFLGLMSNLIFSRLKDELYEDTSERVDVSEEKCTISGADFFLFHYRNSYKTFLMGSHIANTNFCYSSSNRFF